MTALELVKKIEENDFVGLVIGGYSAVELQAQAEELEIELSDNVANVIAAHYQKFNYGVNLNEEDRTKFIQGLKKIELGE